MGLEQAIHEARVVLGEQLDIPNMVKTAYEPIEDKDQAQAFLLEFIRLANEDFPRFVMKDMLDAAVKFNAEWQQYPD